MKLRVTRYVFALLLSALLHACGGGGGSAVGSSVASVSGVAATGAAINGSVTLKDAAGTARSAVISQPSGTFSIEVAGLTPPYFLKAEDNTGTVVLYSVATGTGNFNINPLSNLVAVSAAMSIDPLAKTPDAAFNNPASFANLTPAHIRAATDGVMSQMSPAFKATLSANGAGNSNPLTDDFRIGDGLDRTFDAFAITLNASTGEVQERQVASNTTTVVGLVDMLGAFPAAGIYDGTVNIHGGVTHQAKDILITPSGEMRYTMDNGVMVVANLSVSGSTVSGAGKAYAPAQSASFRFADGSRAIDLAISGTLGSGILSGAYSYGSFQDTFSFALNPQQTSISSSPNKIAGTYASTTETGTVFIGHIEANGKIWGSGPDIAYSGLISAINPNINIYRVTLAYSRNGTYGFISGLATFYETSLTADSLSQPMALVPAGYLGDVANLVYSQAITGNHGKLLMHLSSPLQQISLAVARMDTQPRSIVTRPTPDSLMIQAISDEGFSATATGNIQYGESSPSVSIAGNRVITAGIGSGFNIISNPGNIALNGPTRIAIPITQTQAQNLPALPQNQQLPGQVINWTAFNITPGAEVNFLQPAGNQAVLNRVSVSGNTVTGTLASSGQIYLVNNSGVAVSDGSIALTGGIVISGATLSNGGNIVAGGGNLSLSAVDTTASNAASS